MGGNGNTRKIDGLLKREYSQLPIGERPWEGTYEWVRWVAEFRMKHSQAVDRMEAPGPHTAYLSSRASEVLEFMGPPESEREKVIALIEERREAFKKDWGRTAIPLVKALIGKTILNRSVSMDACDSVLRVFHEIGCESIFALFLDSESKCIHSEIRFGNETSVAFPPTEIVEIAVRNHAKKIILAHNHPPPFECSEPSDADCRHAAALATRLPCGIELVDDLVWCRVKTESLMTDLRYLDLIRSY